MMAFNGDEYLRKSAPLLKRNRHRYTSFYNTKIVASVLTHNCANSRYLIKTQYA